MKPVLWITGCSGFTGRHLVHYLKQLSDSPFIVGLDLTNECSGDVDRYYCIDLLQPENIKSLAHEEMPEFIIHLAGRMPPSNEVDMWRSNVGATMSLYQGVASAGCKGVRILNVGSSAEYIPSPSEVLTETSACGGYSAYGRIKLAQTLVALKLGKDMGLSTIVSRAFNLIGPGISPHLVAGWLCEHFSKNKPVEKIVLGNIKTARDFVDVRDAVRAYWLLVLHGKAGEIYNVCTGVAHTVENLVEIFKEKSGLSPQIRIDPEKIRKSDPQVSYGDYSKLRRVADWEPSISLEESILAMINDRT